MKDPAEVDLCIDAELRALGAVTARALPTMRQTEAMLRAKGQAQRNQGGAIMEAMHRMKRHSRALTGLCAGAVAAALLVMPISYERTVGHTVQITLPGGKADPARVQRAVRQARLALHAQGLKVTAEDSGTVLVARVPVRSRAEVQRRADAVLRGLAAENITALVQITPRTEQVAGRVYAMALDKVVEIRVDQTGKTAAQIEAEIRDQLSAQGVSGAEVQVHKDGAETQVQIGADLDDNRRIQIDRRTVGGPPVLEMKVGDLDTAREPGMTDAQLREKIERQLRARGLDPQVTVQGDEVRIRAHKTAAP